MERVSDEYLRHLHDLYDRWITVNPYKAEDEPTAQLMADILNHQIRSTRDALTELRERREAENRIGSRCPICGTGHDIGNPCYGTDVIRYK